MALSTRSLTAGFSRRAPVFEDIGLDLPAGARGVLLGPNGAGKTTLLRCLSGALKPLNGEVLVDAERLRHDRRGLRAHRAVVQLVLQDPDDQLFSADVFQDVSFGPLNLGLTDEEAAERVRESLDSLGITHLADRPTHQLSFGERKRVAIAGAVAMRPGAILLDEPTAGLDPEGVRALLGVLEALSAQGTTLLLATHDVEVALEFGTHAAVFAGGMLHQGLPVDLLSNAELRVAAGLTEPWPVAVARACGWDDIPTTRGAVLTRLVCSPR